MQGKAGKHVLLHYRAILQPCLPLILETFFADGLMTLDNNEVHYVYTSLCLYAGIIGDSLLPNETN